MYKKVRRNYMKLLLPVAAVLLAACAILLGVTRFGIRYAFVTSLPIESIPAGELDGACAQVQTTQLEGTFARAGTITQAEADESGEEVDILERYCMVQLEDGKYIGVKISGRHLDDVASFGSAVTELGMEQAKSLDFGLMRGTVGEMPDELYELFCSWADQYIDGADGTQEFYDANLYRLMLNVDYYGPFSQGTTIFITIVAAVLLALALALLISGFCGAWDRNIRRAMKEEGRDKLEAEFAAGETFGGRLCIGSEHIWCFSRFTTDIFKGSDVVWTYARSRRLEGGRLTWLIVMKTGDKREYSALLGDASNVQAAEEKLKSLVKPLCTGFDKEKQKLYDRDISTFKARVKNGTI